MTPGQRYPSFEGFYHLNIFFLPHQTNREMLQALRELENPDWGCDIYPKGCGGVSQFITVVCSDTVSEERWREIKDRARIIIMNHLSVLADASAVNMGEKIGSNQNQDVITRKEKHV